MYENHFGLRRRPFRPLPDCDAYYPATTHEQALHQLLQALAADEGHMLLMGLPGTGKTLLAHCLLERLEPNTTCAFVTNSHVPDRTALLQAVLHELSLPHAEPGEQALRLALTDFLLDNFKAGKRALLLVDEAHHLGPDLLEELRLLGNLEARHGKALQVILLAQPGIETTLGRPELAALRQRIAVPAVLEPLGPDEAADYLLHQIRAAGGRPEAVMEDEAVALLARAAHGVPRVLNQAAHQAMLLAHAAGQIPVDAEAALEALHILGLAADEEVSASAGLSAAGGAANSDAELADDSVVRTLAPRGADVARRAPIPPRRPA